MGIKNQGYTYSSKKEASRVVEDGYNRDKYSIELSRKNKLQKSISISPQSQSRRAVIPELVAEEPLAKPTEKPTHQKPQPTVSSEVVDRSALKDVESTAKALEGWSEEAKYRKLSGIERRIWDSKIRVSRRCGNRHNFLKKYRNRFG